MRLNAISPANPPPSLPETLDQCRLLIGSRAFEVKQDFLTIGERAEEQVARELQVRVRIPGDMILISVTTSQIGLGV